MNKVALSHRPSCVYSSAGYANGSGTIPEDINEIWLVQEWCDIGTLESAISRGRFRKSNGELDMVGAADIAEGAVNQ